MSTEESEGSPESLQSLTRRSVLKGAAALGTLAPVAALGLHAAAREAAAAPEHWDAEADVVCVGFGGAGAVAAITAHDAGAEVLVLEKMAQGGGNTACSLGGILCPTNVEEAYTHITALFDYSHSELDKGLVRTYCEEAVKNVDWVKGLRAGTEVFVYGGAGYPQVPGAASMKKYNVRGPAQGPAGNSQNLWGLLTYAIEIRKIRVMFATPARELVTNRDGEVIGVRAEAQGKPIVIRARRGVILTTGGYEYDRTTLQNSVKGYPIYALGSPGNTGDGVRMAQKVGASLWHMNGVSCPLGIKVPDLESAFLFQTAAAGYILVDKHGRRFANERAVEAHAGLLAVDVFDVEELEYPRIPCYVIFDEATRLRGPISAMAALGFAGRAHKWSRDNSVEVEKGWILKGDTPAELARKIQMRPEVLESTLAKWNADMKQGEDTLFHRPLRAPANDNPAYRDLQAPLWSALIEKPPYYAIALYPCLLNTQGGPRRNTKAQLLDAFGRPIPRLYSAGELGSMWGLVYQGAGNIGECVVYGRIAGKNAAQEKPLA
ncbi:MAG TPA: FAD-binding protein [Candidatus Sulfotelmatobacter sp.]|nr:FAD-binding protein [Candidatus Sulfotelmatobacter sp.]